MTSQRDTTSPFRTPELRAVDPSTCRASRAEHESDCNCTDCRLARAERTNESLRAQAAYRAPTEHPFAVSRMQAATLLGEVMHDHDVSKNRLADLLGVDEKQIRKYLDGRAHLPMAALLVMPVGMSDDYMARLRAARGGTKSSAERFRFALAALEKDGASDALKLEAITRLSAIRGGR